MNPYIISSIFSLGSQIFPDLCSRSHPSLLCSCSSLCLKHSSLLCSIDWCLLVLSVSTPGFPILQSFPTLPCNQMPVFRRPVLWAYSIRAWLFSNSVVCWSQLMGPNYICLFSVPHSVIYWYTLILNTDTLKLILLGVFILWKFANFASQYFPLPHALQRAGHLTLQAPNYLSRCFLCTWFLICFLGGEFFFSDFAIRIWAT